MKVLVLSPQADLLVPTIVASGDEAIVPPASIQTMRGKDVYQDVRPEDWPEADFVVLFNYRTIVKRNVLERYPNRIINIHTSVLPYNRGAHPNFWSWFDNTPKGVSIHRVNEKIDDGELLAVCKIGDEVFLQPRTLESTRTDLIFLAAGLFNRRWKGGGEIDVKSEVYSPYMDQRKNYHNSNDIKPFFAKLSRGWQTSVYEVRCLGKIYRGEQCPDLK